jgi:predicted amidohydrolase YtcJ
MRPANSASNQESFMPFDRLRARTVPTIYRGGQVYVPSQPGATAFVVSDGRVAFLGADLGAHAFASGARVVDLGGRLVTPAFADAHLHAIQTGLVMAGLDLSPLASREAVLSALSTYVQAHPQAKVVVGQGWDERAWPDPRPPSRPELDRAGAGLAVYLARVDVHSAVVSSALLDELPDIRDLAGYSDSGLLTRDAHHACRGKMDGLFSDAERRSAARAALTRATEVGIAAVHELGGPHLGPLADLVRVAEVGAEIGVAVVTYWGELASEDAIARARSVGAAGLAGDLCVDGAIGSRTAAMHEPYADHPSTGVRYLSDDDITDHVIACTRAGLQAGFHAIGDDAVAATIEGFRRAAARLGVEPVRSAAHRIEHVEMLAEQDIGVLTELGITACMQPAFDAFWGRPGELYDQRLGLPRSRQMNRLGTLQRAGVALAFGSDAPVTPIAGWETVRAAACHQTPTERMSVPDAFTAATVGPYAAARKPGGALLVGEPASFAVWEAEAGTLGPTGLPELDLGAPSPTCVATVAAGQVVFAIQVGRL